MLASLRRGAVLSRRALSTTQMHGTTILCVRRKGRVCLIGDGQVSMGSIVVKGNAKKVRRVGDDVLVGFAGSTADAFSLLDRLEKKLDEHPGQLARSCVELAKAWRTDKYLRRLEAVLLVADRTQTFELTGTGDVLEPSDGIMGGVGRPLRAARRAAATVATSRRATSQRWPWPWPRMCVTRTTNSSSASSTASFPRATGAGRGRRACKVVSSRPETSLSSPGAALGNPACTGKTH